MRPSFLFFALFLFLIPARAQTLSSAAPPSFSNATAAEWPIIRDVLGRLESAANARDANALQFYGVASVPSANAQMRLQIRNTHLAVSAAGALVRQVFGSTLDNRPLSSGVHELWLARLADGTFALTPRRFLAPAEAAVALDDVAQSEWKAVQNENGAAMLDLIAARVGGRWIALRSQRWDGGLYQDDELVDGSRIAPRDYVRRKMATAPANRAITAHFVFQRGASGWVGVGAAFDGVHHLNAADDNGAAMWREKMMGVGYLSALAHRDFAAALGNAELWNEAADEYQKAELLQPGLVGATILRDAENARERDPQNLVARQQKNEQTVGLGAEHPTFLINALLKEQNNQPSALGALRLALEYSRLGEEERAAAWQKASESLIPGGRGPRPMDAAWINLLYDHLTERRRLATTKPTILLRSALFTVRVWPNDPGAIPVLAALEEAQHTVYDDFGIPMGNTEVTLWRNQSEFARYTTQFSAQGSSEFVAALTLTKLVATRNGPLVLGEEINTFADARDRDALFGTVAHEYGHVAVRQMAKGRLVPVWFNEGIATSVEGGYDGYLPRVRRAANAGLLLSMREMQNWNVDGERAFLAYSQANSVLDYIVAKWGKGAVLEILRQISRDVAPDQAFQAVLKLTPAQLQDRWVREGIK